MATTPEGTVKRAIKKVLNKHGVYSHMPVQNGMGQRSLDYVCCFRGLYIAIEAKAPGKKPTEQQFKTMAKIRNAGGYAFVVDGPEKVELLDRFLTKFSTSMEASKKVRAGISKL